MDNMPQRRPRYPRKNPTYKNPGECIKCDGSERLPRINFDGAMIGIAPNVKMVGGLWATCQKCGFKWYVKSKDEDVE